MIQNLLQQQFDFVGVIDVKRYVDYTQTKVDLSQYKSMFVVGLAYGKEVLPHTKKALTASLYTYGLDYHVVFNNIFKNMNLEDNYLGLVDNHDLDERTALELTGLAYRGKNNLMIHKELGSYFFIGLVLSKIHYDEVIIENHDSCGDCVKCIKACPVGALSRGYQVDKCISAYNQTKKVLNQDEVKHNYLLLGCDICQRVCPKNKGIKVLNHEAFKIYQHAYVEINDLFNLSNKAFKDKYGNASYLWRGKTLLMRNALTVLLKQDNKDYNELIRQSLKSTIYPKWYKETAQYVLEKLEG